MLLAGFWNSEPLLLVGVVLVIGSLLMRRRMNRAGGQVREPLQEMLREFREVEGSYAGQLAKMEVRLHDYGRELEARMQTRIAVLDRLVTDADREILRLERLLDAPRGLPAPHTRAATGDILTGAEAQREAPRLQGAAALAGASANLGRTVAQIYALAEQKLSAPEIADRLGLPVGQVALLLNLTGKRPDSAAA